MTRILIIGGGAAGYAAAITAARRGAEVTVVERNRRPLKKLGVTGNGRGNLLNDGAPQYFGDEAFALHVLERMPASAVADFLKSCGIALAREEEGRIYPSSFLAASAVEALLACARRLGVRTLLSHQARRIEKTEDGFLVHARKAIFAPDTVLKSGRVKPGEQVSEEDVTLSCERVIVCAGGAASPIHGTDGTAYGLLTDWGHTLVPVHPSLCALTSPRRAVEGLAGQRVRASLSLNGHESSGEALFADDGVSGIAAMALARFVTPGCVLEMDLRPALMGVDMHLDPESWLALRPGDTIGERLTGACSQPLGRAILKKAALSEDHPATAEIIRKAASVIRRFAVEITGTRGFDNAQVTAGGISCAEFDPSTMESLYVRGVYAAGEVLDVDGACGGFNLLFAFASGIVAGMQ